MVLDKMSDGPAPRKQPSAQIAVFEQARQELTSREDRKRLSQTGRGGSAASRSKQSRKGKEKSKEALKSLDLFAGMDEHHIPLETLFERFGTHGTQGLTDAAANQRLREDGENRLSEKKGTPWYILFIKELTGFFSILLWIASILCFIGYGLAPDDMSNLWLGIVLAVVVFLTGCFSYYQEAKSAAIMASFKNFVPPQTEVRRENQQKVIPAAQVVRGDIIILREGSRIPADMRILSSNELKVDNSSLTGESEPILLTHECTDADNPAETKNLAFFGTMCVHGNGEGIVVRVGDKTVIGQIAHMTQSGGHQETPLGKEIKRFVLIISAVAITLGIIFFIFGIIYQYDYITNLVFAIGIIVANVPEGLLATVTVSLTLTAKRMAGKAVLVKNLESVETLGSTTCICTDKTGTLTQNKMTVRNVWYNGELVPAVNKEMNPNEVEYDEGDSTFQMLSLCAILSSKSNFQTQLPQDKQLKDKEKKNMTPEQIADREHQLLREYLEIQRQLPIQDRDTTGDASESGIVKFFHPLRSLDDTRKSFPTKLQDDTPVEIPFNSRHKYAMTIHDPLGRYALPGHENDMVLFIKGAPEIIWAKCDYVLNQGNADRKDAEWQANYDATNDALAKEGERVLGFAMYYLPADRYPRNFRFNLKNAFDINIEMQGYTFLGLVSLMDPPRPNVREAVDQCRSAGVKVIMVTGDQPKTAASIAKQVHIVSPDVQTNYDLMDQQGLSLEEAEEICAAVVVHGTRIDQILDGVDDDADDAEDQRAAKLAPYILKPEVVFARTTPAHKMIIVQACQKVSHIVAVTGDGVNDSPAIKKADIGIAMGLTGNEVAKDAADMLLLDDNFASIVKGVEEGRLIFDNLKKSIAYTLSSNIPEIGPFLSFIVFQLPLPLSTVLILCVDLGTDMIPAISLAYETSELDIMQRLPRDADVDHLVTLRLISFSYLQIGMIQCLAGFYTYFVVMNDYGFPPGLLFFWALSEDGAEPDGDDVYTPEHKYNGNTHVDLDDFDGNRVDWITNDHDDLDLRVWFYDYDEDDWTDCRFPDKESHVSDEDVCYTTEALKHAQCAYFVSIVIVQWADLLICKTRKLSIYHQGMLNNMMNFGLFFETALAILLCYVPPLNIGLGTRDLVFQHLGIPAMPYFVVIFLYDEIRKFLMRYYRETHPTPDGKGMIGWLENNTYY